MEKLKDICSEAVSKKELASIDRDFAQDVTQRVLSDNQVYQEWKAKEFDDRSSERKQLVKMVRRELRDVYGVFFTNPLSPSERQAIQDDPSDENLKDVMKRHLSTRERLPQYPYLYDHMSSWFGSYSSILDIGCGYNPLSIPVFNQDKSVKIIDISGAELRFLESVLHRRGIRVSSDIIDVSNQENFSKMFKSGEISDESGSYDVAFCFKLFDSLETKNRGITATLLECLRDQTNKGIVVSFARRTVSGRNKIDAERVWFYDALESLDGFERKDVETINETYHLIRWKNA
jgi:16S rRNA (guanine(1405)-N(7))-methyltransferase